MKTFILTAALFLFIGGDLLALPVLSYHRDRSCFIGCGNTSYHQDVVNDENGDPIGFKIRIECKGFGFSSCPTTAHAGNDNGLMSAFEMDNIDAGFDVALAEIDSGVLEGEHVHTDVNPETGINYEFTTSWLVEDVGGTLEERITVAIAEI